MSSFGPVLPGSDARRLRPVVDAEDRPHHLASTRGNGWDKPQIRLQLIGCDSLTSDGFVRPPAIEPSPPTSPRFQHLE